MSDGLETKKAIADMLIGMLADDDDPRAPAAIANLERQKAILDEMMAEDEQVNEGNKPADVVIGLKPLQLSGRAAS